MNFDYDKIKKKLESEGTQWASYSDLFMVLSVVFLLLYVSASLRSGTTSIQQQQILKQAQQDVEDMKQQVQVYETLKKEYLAKGASQDEQETYTELMDKLSLLKDEAKQEKEDLTNRANENAKKEMALNKYQKIIGNIINANMVAQARIKKRDNIIVDKQAAIKTLNQDIKSKAREIKSNKAKIANIESDLEKNIKNLQQSYRHKKRQKKVLLSKIEELKHKSAESIKSLEAQNEEASQSLSNAQSELNYAQKIIENKEEALKLAQSEILEKSHLISKKEVELKQKEEQVAEVRRQSDIQMEQAKSESAAIIARARKQGAEAQKRAAQESAALLAKVRSEQAQKLAKVNAQLQGKEQEIAQTVAEKNSQVAALSGELKAAQARANARKVLASKIISNFKKSGIKAKVDQKTGDVTIQFGREYFSTGKADLKPGMKKILRDLMPVYAESLLADKSVANKIEAVEITGYASPTYKGRYVDPNSLDAQDKSAREYNLKLSLERATSTFKYVFDKNSVNYAHQKELLPLVKVSGKSYFAAKKVEGRAPSNMTREEFCKFYSCEEAQRVQIKFRLKD